MRNDISRNNMVNQVDDKNRTGNITAGVTNGLQDPRITKHEGKTDLNRSNQTGSLKLHITLLKKINVFFYLI